MVGVVLVLELSAALRKESDRWMEVLVDTHPGVDPSRILTIAAQFHSSDPAGDHLAANASALDAVQVGVRPGTRGNPVGLGSVLVAPHEKFLKLIYRKRGRHGELVSCVVVAVTCVRVVSRSSPCCHRVVTAVVPV